MSSTTYTNVILTIIALCLMVIAARDLVPEAKAQTGSLVIAQGPGDPVVITGFGYHALPLPVKIVKDCIYDGGKGNICN